MKKNNYYDNDGADYSRSRRTKKKKKHGALKGFIVFISIIVVALAVFVTTVKFLAPDFDLTTLVPKKAVTFVDEKIRGNTTTAPETTTKETTTKPTTTERVTEKMMSYLDSSEFKIETSKTGNLVGNLMNGGKVATDYSYIYYVASGGLYRFEPDEETYTRIYDSTTSLSSLNLRGDFLYFVDDAQHKLLKMQKGAEAPKTVADNISFAYVYDSTVYFVTVNNDIGVMDAKELQPKILYSSADDEMRFVGASLHRVFFAVKDYSGNVDYLTIATDGNEQTPSPFRKRDEGFDSKLVLENGFMYFYSSNNNGTYNVCRQKFGSEKVITLANDSDYSNYIAVENNRLYYPQLADGKFNMMEINMNSKKSRCLLSVGSVQQNHTLRFFHGGEYDFILGNKSEGGEYVYRGGCMYTGSTNYMSLEDGKWRY
ncbi:MAG: hypothetical protein IKF64_06065 [Eubacterium sp.]|nr:hypothetical protein [Eubacterium sp.]